MGRLSGAMIAAIGFGLTLVIGLALLTAGSASSLWLAVQVGAGALSLALFLPAVRRFLPRMARAVLVVAPLALLATVLLDDGLDGVHRWLSLGPLRLHMGMLLLPVLLAVHARADSRYSGLSLIGCAAVIGLQPDFAMALAATCALLMSILLRRGREDGLALVATGAALILCLVTPDPLQPVRMVEHVLTDSWRWTIWTGPLALIGALILPAALLLRARTNPSCRPPAFALIGLWLGLLLASLIGHYPVPLLGYGASAVIGWGIALAWMEAPAAGARPGN